VHSSLSLRSLRAVVRERARALTTCVLTALKAATTPQQCPWAGGACTAGPQERSRLERSSPRRVATRPCLPLAPHLPSGASSASAPPARPAWRATTDSAPPSSSSASSPSSSSSFPLAAPASPAPPRLPWAPRAPSAAGARPRPRRGRLARQLLRQLALQRLDLGKRARRQSPYPTRMPTLILPYGRPSPPAAPSARPSAPQPGRPRGASETAIPKLRGGASEGPELKSAACFQGPGLPAPAGRTALPRWCGPARQLTSISPSSATRAPSVRRVAFHMRGRHLPDCRGSWAPPRLPQQARSQPSTHARRPGSAYPCSVAPVRNWAVSGS